MRTRYPRYAIAIAAALAALSSYALSQPLLAQSDDAPREDTLFFVANGAAVMPFGGAVHVVGGEGSVLGEVVTGTPYSADSITESVQMLADGNRITNTHRARVYRDSEGRTRREQTLDAIGVWQTGSEPMTMITINDPVANLSYHIDPTTETVRPVQPFRLQTELRLAGEPPTLEGTAGTSAATAVAVVGAEPGQGVAVDVQAVAPGQGPAPVMQPFERRFVGGPPGTFNVPVNVTASWAAEPIAATTEDLGEQVLQGVLAHGSRQTQTIPVGAIGNERPIDIVTEQWYSDELEALILRTSSDPRFGVTTYRLINVDQSEPPAELFAPPQSYELQSTRPGPGVGQRALRAPPPGAPGQRIFVIQQDADGDSQ